eukprot:40283-Ditylum_brightwellii.AAC.1
MGFVLNKNGENVVLYPAMIGGVDKGLTSKLVKATDDLKEKKGIPMVISGSHIASEFLSSFHKRVLGMGLIGGPTYVKIIHRGGTPKDKEAVWHTLLKFVTRAGEKAPFAKPISNLMRKRSTYTHGNSTEQEKKTVGTVEAMLKLVQEALGHMHQLLTEQER